MEIKITVNQNLIPNCYSFQIHAPILFFRRFNPHIFKYVNETSILQFCIFILPIMKIDFIRRFTPESEISIYKFTRIPYECSIRYEKWNELRMSFNSIRIT